MNKYKKYKDSGIEWIGEIPEHWDIAKFNHVIFLRHGYQFRDYDFTNDGLKIIKITQLKANGELDIENASFIDRNRLDNFKEIIIKEGDILMALTGGTIGKIIMVKEVKEPLLQNYRVGNFSPLSDKLSKSFLFWILSSNYILDQIFYDQRETGQPNIGKENFGRMFLAIPNNKTEQTAIAAYLDRKTAEIDELISQKQKLLELYEEEKTAIINQAVTKGINPDVKMKDSGIEWLGEIPEHWEVKKLKYVAKIVLGKMLTTKDKGGNLLKPYLRAANLNWIDVNISEIKQMWFSEKEIKKYRLIKDDILVSEGGEVGRTCIWRDELKECYIQNSVHKVTVNKSNYAHYFLNQFFLFGKKGAFDFLVNRISIAHLTVEKLKEIKFIAPPLKEQTAIVRHIETETARINTKVEKTKKLIELLKEYKTALISEVVTGKVKVTA